MTEQLSLFSMHSVQVCKPSHDPYWDEIMQEKPSIKPGDFVKISADWMQQSEARASGNAKKDYQFTTEQELICKVLWVDPRGSGDISVSRNGYGLYIPAGYFTLINDGDTVDPVLSCGTATEQATKHSLLGLDVVKSSLFTTENVREHDTENPAPAQLAPEHIHWLEEYWVKRGSKKHYYYRYCWMIGRKIKRLHIGPIQSAIAKNRKSEIESAIADGDSPGEIQNLIRAWCKQQ